MSTKNLHQRIHAVMSEVGTIAKTGYNSFHKYNYAKESDFVETLRPLLIKHGLTLVPLCDSISRTGEIVDIVLAYTITNIDNPDERIVISVPASGQDKGDKAAYKAITGAKKYALANTFMIATGDDPEKDDVDHKKTLPKKTVKTSVEF